MALYLVVRHPLDARRSRFDNEWLNDELTSITTTPEIGMLCRAAMARNDLVYIHRCGWDDYVPTVCCSVHVAEVNAIGELPQVRFRDQTLLNIVPGVPPPPGPGDNYYHAPPP